MLNSDLKLNRYTEFSILNFQTFPLGGRGLKAVPYTITEGFSCPVPAIQDAPNGH